MKQKTKAKSTLLVSVLVLGVGVSACSKDAETTGQPPAQQISNSNSSGLESQDVPHREWHPPRSEERKGERGEMVDLQIDRRGISDEKVLEAMRQVPRHWFVPLFRRGEAYEDQPLGIGGGQTISQPYIVALMTQALDLQPGEKVLEVGTGSGYQAAVLSEITPEVYTVEIIEELAEDAAKLFQEKGYTVIHSKAADGYYGWEEHAPYDAIIVTCAASHIPPALVQQLKPGGQLCIPVGGPFSTQRLMLLTKKEDGTTTSKNLELVRFVPMTGAIEEQ